MLLLSHNFVQQFHAKLTPFKFIRRKQDRVFGSAGSGASRRRFHSRVSSVRFISPGSEGTSKMLSSSRWHLMHFSSLYRSWGLYFICQMIPLFPSRSTVRHGFNLGSVSWLCRAPPVWVEPERVALQMPWSRADNPLRASTSPRTSSVLLLLPYYLAIQLA